MKAIEAMEKAEQRKKDSHDEAGTKRRRSSSSYKNDSNLDASSADESKPEPKMRNRKKGRSKAAGGVTPVGTPGTPQRRRSRVMSGGSASNMSADESMTPGNGGCDSAAVAVSANLENRYNGPFRFPKTKKSLMSDWLQESESNNSINDDDDVSANYLKGSRSPPGIATHLLRSSSAASSPVKNVCSAKKRWLRQAISEDHTDEITVNGSASPSSAEAVMDMVTPLKKRRLANYKEDQEQEHPEDQMDNVKVPNGLKKQILQNLVVEAVLNKAMEDMLATPAASTVAASEVKPEVKEEVKAPEPNSAFKSFFNTNVALEALEAEIAASKKQREEEHAQTFSPPPNDEVKQESVEMEVGGQTENVSADESAISACTPLDDSALPNKTEEQTKAEKINETVIKEEEQPQLEEVEEPVGVTLAASSATPPPTPQLAVMEAKPKAKKRVSLADYKSLRRVSSSNSTPSTPVVEATPPTLLSTAVSLPPVPLPATAATTSVKEQPQAQPLEDPGTPTQDEHTASSATMLTSTTSSNLPPTLNTLPLFEKLDKLELAQQEIKRKASQNSYISLETTSVASPVFEPKREDLTSRLQKEFGLLVDNDLNEDDQGADDDAGDATPEEDSPPPPPTTGPASTRFLPSQIPSYTQNYPPPPPRPSHATSAAAPAALGAPVPHHSYTSKYPPPPPPPSSSGAGGLGFQGSLNFPPPPPPVNYGKEHMVQQAQALPPPPPAPLPALKANGPSLTSSSRRPPSKDYYNRGSPGGGGGRGYYTSNSHRDQRREHHGRDRDGNRDHRDRDHRDHRDRDYRSQQSSSSRRAYQSRNYY